MRSPSLMQKLEHRLARLLGTRQAMRAMRRTLMTGCGNAWLGRRDAFCVDGPREAVHGNTRMGFVH